MADRFIESKSLSGTVPVPEEIPELYPKIKFQNLTLVIVIQQKRVLTVTPEPASHSWVREDATIFPMDAQKFSLQVGTIVEDCVISLERSCRP